MKYQNVTQQRCAECSDWPDLKVGHIFQKAVAMWEKMVAEIQITLMVTSFK